ncbi:MULTISPECIES: HD-GYP domain-containing protein [Roseateles]|uniref:Nucleotidyltransferase with HDIG domain n=1 Tax=Pelomonas aquatica TaxID=431058 RepID=A0ABU1ZC67_9BURK|nr:MULTISPECIES: HD-GYP domain-containing protein [Roseateles]KQY83445.1 phosphohydrolase [Pelomonas sp. Root1444]MDR7298212.1 putative nucleotidyltransferase with HDIG domain [Pelomonas aquatica]
MQDRSNDPLIDVSQLTVGMFIHLDLGWMSHPFPLSSFKIASSDQLLILRRLGLTQVRWSPAKSDVPLQPPAEQAAAVQPGAEALPPAPAEPSPEDIAREAHRRALAAQREAMRLCEAQYGEAAQGFRAVMDLVQPDPNQARANAERLTAALLDKMLVEGDLNMRLLNEAAGDRSTAHALNVCIIALLLGRAFGLGRDEMMDLGVGSLLHDVGKLEIAARLRHRDESFTTAENQAYQQHVVKGVAIAQAMGMPPGPLLIIAQHHEHADGSGFPQRINMDRMSTGARIVALVNRFDGLCNPLLPSKAMTPHEALSLMFAQGRNRFDATMLNAFIRMMGVYPPGSTVQLTDDRYALVVSVNSARPLKPRVMVHDPKVPKDEALILNLEEMPDLGIRRSLKPQFLPRASLEYLSPRARIAYFFDAASTGPGELAA